MQKWEYLKVKSPTTAQMNELGQEGWELVAVTFNAPGSAVSFYFKRPLSS